VKSLSNDQNSGRDFDTFAEDYGTVLDSALAPLGQKTTYFDDYKIDCLRRVMVTGPRPSHVLDFGCGVGRLSCLLARELPEASVCGVDTSPASLSQAALLAAGIPNVTFSESIPSGGLYDLTIAANVLHHIPRGDRVLRLGELGRCLSPEGRLVIFEHNPLNPLTRIIVARCAFDRDASLLRRAEVGRLARAAGLRSVGHRYIVFFPPHLACLRSVESLLSPLPFGAQYMVVLQHGRTSEPDASPV